ncbi:MAG: LacI family DNA-binding transcriptional regulator [Bacteroidales bacterium]|nr:LacI family DNA-binding transcriptional regulator [Bacteroidales bacterium]MCB8999070.1 LacI family DNA-binding transcriptional regulator [Bacteroidales bacterium]
MKVRIKDIANLAGVSVGTVDRVIHNRGEVSDTTRRKVQAILNKSEYKPDIVARALTSRKNYIFAVIMPVSANENDFWHSPFSGIERALEGLERFGVHVKAYLFDQFNRQSFAAKAFDLLSDHPDGILFAPVFLEDSLKFIRECKVQKIPVALFNSNIPDAEVSIFIGQNAMQSGYTAGRLLQYSLHGESDVLIINLAARKDNYNHVIQREKGFREFFEKQKSPDIRLHTIDTNHSSDEKLISELNYAFSKLSVKGIFVTNSRVYKVAKYLLENNKTGIRLIGYDLLPANIEALKSGIIDFLISQRPAEQAYKGLNTLFNIVALKNPGPEIQYTPIDIINKENIDYYDYK